jgi:F-type H+-transporting ATPase subunit b
MAETAHNTSTAAPGGEQVTFPPFNSETFPSQLVWLVIAFVLLYALMAKWVLPRVGHVIENRQKHIADDIAEAEGLKTQSEEALAAYEQALADARARAQAIANEEREREAAAAEVTRKQLETALNSKLAEAEKTIAATKQAAMANVRGIAEDAATAIVERLIGSTPSNQAVAAAAAEALKR